MDHVGIDLGTTHTVLAYAEGGVVSVLPLSQQTGLGVEARTTLASCLYAPLPEERAPKEWVCGALAKERAPELPERSVVSHKSWLCHGGVRRTAPILPWGLAQDGPRIAPVDAAAVVLAHVREAWEKAKGRPLQDAVLTVPASFDMVSRELSVRAAESVGLGVRLLEEPQAVFYDWISRRGTAELLCGRPRATVLVCDVGGGTTDFSLFSQSGPSTERIATGRHLLLGGDNMDLALAHALEPRLLRPGEERLSGPEFHRLLALARQAKEHLLGGPAESVPITLLGRGNDLFQGRRTATLTSGEVRSILVDGFFPVAAKDERPSRIKSGLVAFGLPYERDPAISKHLAEFLLNHDVHEVHAVLLHGGVFLAKPLACRLTEILRGWFGEALPVYVAEEPELGVARGAAIFAATRHVAGAVIDAGTSRGYYVRVRGQEGSPELVCVVPRGLREGIPLSLSDPSLLLTVGRPVRFEAYAARGARADAHGERIPFAEETFEKLPPLVATVPRFSKQEEVEVDLLSELSAAGTLLLSLIPRGHPEARSRLSFELASRPSESPARDSAVLEVPRGRSKPPSSGGLSHVPEGATRLLDSVYGVSGLSEAKHLLRDLEKELGERATWNIELVRALSQKLLSASSHRRRTSDHERLYWMLLGYCLRPGYGALGDEARALRVAKMVPERLQFPEARNWVQFWIALRRVAPGFSELDQTKVFQMVAPFVAPKSSGLKPSKKFTPEGTEEMVELLSVLERLPSAMRSSLGEWILERILSETNVRLVTLLGRVGARIPTYASAHHVVPASHVEEWMTLLLRGAWNPPMLPALVAMCEVTGDRTRDLSERVRASVYRKVLASGGSESLARRVLECVARGVEFEFFGENLPLGLRLATSASPPSS